MNRRHIIFFLIGLVVLTALSCDRINIAGVEPESIDFQIVGTLHEPRLFSPKDGIVITRSGPVSLRWGNIISATRYAVQLSRDSTFSAFIVNALTDTTVIQTLPQDGGRFYWRVRARNERFESPWSEVWQFRILPPT